MSGEWVDTKVYSDLDDIYSYEKNHRATYSQRVVDLAVVETGEKLGVTTYIIVPPTICKLSYSDKFHISETVLTGSQMVKATASLQPSRSKSRTLHASLSKKVGLLLLEKARV